jgi:hypothetical protein
MIRRYYIDDIPKPALRFVFVMRVFVRALRTPCIMTPEVDDDLQPQSHSVCPFAPEGLCFLLQHHAYHTRIHHTNTDTRKRMFWRLKQRRVRLLLLPITTMVEQGIYYKYEWKIELLLK